MIVTHQQICRISRRPSEKPKGIGYAYKCVTKGYMSPVYKRGFYNSPPLKYEIGSVVKNQEGCDPDRSVDCSYGLHIASATWCKQKKYGSKFILVSFDWKDAVIPRNSFGKFRVSKLKVLHEVKL